MFVFGGSRLLSADGDGHIKCWSMSDHLVNSWESVLSSSLDGDPIVALSWLHNGVKLALHVEMVMLADACITDMSGWRWFSSSFVKSSLVFLLSFGSVRFHELWGEVFSGEVLPIFDSVWR